MANLEENYIKAAGNYLTGYTEKGLLQQKGMKPSDWELQAENMKTKGGDDNTEAPASRYT